jgi:hypothetical protein
MKLAKEDKARLGMKGAERRIRFERTEGSQVDNRRQKGRRF